MLSSSPGLLTSPEAMVMLKLTDKYKDFRGWIWTY